MMLGQQIMTPQEEGTHIELHVKNELRSAQTDQVNQQTNKFSPEKFKTDQSSNAVQSDKHRELLLEKEKLQKLLELKKKENEQLK